MAARAVKPDAGSASPRLRRAYYDCRYGQLHLHNAIPAGGGFDELTAVICLHGTGQTGRIFLPLLQVLGTARSVYALDLPGAGETDPAPGVEPVDAATHAVTDFVDSMRIRRYDLIARDAGCLAALKVLEQRDAAVRRVVLIGAPATLRSGPKITLMTPADSEAAGFADRFVALLAGPA